MSGNGSKENGGRTFWALDQRARDNTVSLEARGLWRIIDTFANRFGEGAFPSISKLATLCGRHRNQIFAYLSELEQHGWLTRSCFNGRSNCYLLIYPTRKGKPVTKSVTGDAQKAVTESVTPTSNGIRDTIPYQLTQRNGRSRA